MKFRKSVVAATIAGLIAGGGTVAAVATADVLPGVFYDTSANSYRMVAGVLRQDTPGSGWYLIGGGHQSVNLTVQSVSSDRIVLSMPTATKIVSVLCGPDETLAPQGYSCGVSANYDNLVIKIGKNGQPVDPSTLGLAPFGNLWLMGFVQP